MKRSTLREMARRRWPVVLMDTGSSGEIVYDFIREIKVTYASEAEFRNGAPAERLSVVLADKCGHSYTEALPRQIRLPTVDEMREAIGEGRLQDIRASVAFLDKTTLESKLKEFQTEEESA